MHPILIAHKFINKNDQLAHHEMCGKTKQKLWLVFTMMLLQRTILKHHLQVLVLVLSMVAHLILNVN
jgi:hypothetical protein